MDSLKSSIVEDAIKFQVKAHVSESDGDKLEARQCGVVTEKQENSSPWKESEHVLDRKADNYAAFVETCNQKRTLPHKFV